MSVFKTHGLIAALFLTCFTTAAAEAAISCQVQSDDTVRITWDQYDSMPVSIEVDGQAYSGIGATSPAVLELEPGVHEVEVVYWAYQLCNPILDPSCNPFAAELMESYRLHCEVEVPEPPLTCEVQADGTVLVSWASTWPLVSVAVDGSTNAGMGATSPTTLWLLPGTYEISVIFWGEEQTGCHPLFDPNCQWPPAIVPQVSYTATVEITGTMFVRGDANQDGVVNIADAVRILSYLNDGAQVDCQIAMDCNSDGQVNIADAVYLLSYVNGSGSIAAPFPDCGFDIGSELSCEQSVCP